MEAESTQSTETYLKVLAWLHANQKKLMIGGGVAVAIALVAGFMAWHKAEIEADANAQLLAVPLSGYRGGQLTQTPAEPFLKLANDSPDTSAGEYAELLGAATLFSEGKYPEAHQEFSKFIEGHPASGLLAQAKVGLAAALEGEGKVAEATQKYQEIVQVYSSEANISSPVKLTLARLYEEQNKPEQALTYYSELARINNPYDPWVAEARERGEMLLAKHPELRKAAPASPAGGVPGVAQPPGANPYAPAKTTPTPVPAPAPAPAAKP
jgi:predicted negative regulator of RcsB-dependent stress response